MLILSPTHTLSISRLCAAYLSPCFPPLFGFTNTNRGWVSGIGTIWGKMCNWIRSSESFKCVFQCVDRWAHAAIPDTAQIFLDFANVHLRIAASVCSEMYFKIGKRRSVFIHVLNISVWDIVSTWADSSKVDNAARVFLCEEGNN